MVSATLAQHPVLTIEQEDIITEAIHAFWNHYEDNWTPIEIIRILDSADIKPEDKHAAVLSKLRMTRGNRNNTTGFSRVLMVLGGYAENIDPALAAE